jgi:hypothetical protein
LPRINTCQGSELRGQVLETNRELPTSTKNYLTAESPFGIPLCRAAKGRITQGRCRPNNNFIQAMGRQGLYTDVTD